MLSCSLFLRSSSFRTIRSTSLGIHKYNLNRHFSSNAGSTTVVPLEKYESYLKNIAKVSPPKGLNALLNLITLKGDELVNPSQRKDLIPFLVPISRDKSDNELLCYIRWPTQKEDMDLQLVKTCNAGIKLLSTNTVDYCKRLVVEFDYEGNPKLQEALDLLNESVEGERYQLGDYLPFLKSGKFPAITPEDHRLILDRYILTKIGPFADCYERLATDFLEKNNEVSALVTCERAVSVFYGWGHPIQFHTKMLKKVGRDTEAKDSARASMGMPKWTIGSSQEDLEEACKLAGYSDTRIVGQMHYFRANDKREKDIEEGVSPIQVTLDQAAHLMDAVALGAVEGGWEAIRGELASKYHDGGYPDIAKFINTVE